MEDDCRASNPSVRKPSASAPPVTCISVEPTPAITPEEHPPSIPCSSGENVAKDTQVPITAVDASAPAELVEVKVCRGEQAFSERHPSILNAFLRRIFGILSMQLALTFGISALCMFVTAVRQYCVQHYWAVQLGTLLSGVVVLLALFAVRKRFPVNLLLLALFTVLESWSVGAVCALCAENQAGPAVVAAAGMTMAIFFALTAFCFVSRRDFGFLWGGLASAVMLLAVFGVLIAVFRWRLCWLYALLGAVVICGYILFDVSRILHRLPLDEYIQACVELYMDLLNLFLFLLLLLLSGAKE